MKTMYTIIESVEKDVIIRLKGKSFDTEVAIQEEFNKIWKDLLINIEQMIPDSKFYIENLLRTPPSILQYISSHQNKWEDLIETFFGFRKSKNFVNIDQVCSLIRQELKAVEDIRLMPIEKPIFNETAQNKLLANKFNQVLGLVQRTFGDLYKNKDQENAKRIKRVVKQTLYGIGYEVIEYNNIDDYLFDIREDIDCYKNEIVSPTIRNRMTGKIEFKGIVYQPKKM